jgi:hypothetical protein
MRPFSSGIEFLRPTGFQTMTPPLGGQVLGAVPSIELRHTLLGDVPRSA